MRDRPILFSGPMIRALLAGTKTQTRRIYKPRYEEPYEYVQDGRPYRDYDGEVSPVVCPYGALGDRLWVRESAYIAPPYFTNDAIVNNKKDESGLPRVVDYAATMDAEAVRCAKDYGVKLRPGIHMPRWASRLLLEIKSVRFERLQDISEEDAIEEGMQRLPAPVSVLDPYIYVPASARPRNQFAALWDSINGKKAPWSSNPWVWVIGFERIKEVHP